MHTADRTGEAALHWHAYAKTGDEVYSLPLPYGSHLNGDLWLQMPRDWIAATFDDEDAAHQWLKEQLALYPPENIAEQGYANATLYTRWQLTRERHQTVWADYRDRHGREVVRLLVPCPRPSAPGALRKTPPECPETRRSVGPLPG
ncbi:hypothetical protein ABT083_29905 [Streptomyces goshikiensis]|uniref:hypothetical protein n=1 Tax=Streptomyces goshikiensis TaxID=1942 RepID=UPI0033177D48